MLIEIKKENEHIFYNLAQAYEAEFSAITHKKPNKHGVFELDTKLESSIKGYFWYEDKAPVGFVLIDLGQDLKNVCEFYVIPSYRKKKIGEKFFFEVLKAHPGNWQVKQIQGAHHATAFWRAIIKKFTSGKYKEETFDDPYWGKVTRQLFAA